MPGWIKRCRRSGQAAGPLLPAAWLLACFRPHHSQITHKQTLCGLITQIMRSAQSPNSPTAMRISMRTNSSNRTHRTSTCQRRLQRRLALRCSWATHPLESGCSPFRWAHTAAGGEGEGHPGRVNTCRVRHGSGQSLHSKWAQLHGARAQLKLASARRLPTLSTVLGLPPMLQ